MRKNRKLWRSKKFIIVTATVATVLALGLSGVVFADSNNGNGAKPEAARGAMLDRVCEIYEDNTGVALDSDELVEAFAQAGEEAMAEMQENRLQSLVDDGKITQEQADEIAEWWQSKPDGLPMGRFGGQGFYNGNTLRNRIGHGFGFSDPPMVN